VELEALEAVMGETRDAHARLLSSVEGLADLDVRAPSLLPGWSRGHVLTHLARNADGQRRMLEGALRGEVVEQYAGGREGRAAEIDAGASRDAQSLREDLSGATEALFELWRRMTPEAWDRPTRPLAGERPAWRSVWARWRETEIHHVDLGLDYIPGDWPTAFVSRMLQSVGRGLGRLVPPETVLRVQASDLVFSASTEAAKSEGGEITVEGPGRPLLAWLLGRPVVGDHGLLVLVDGAPAPLPSLLPWA
jgi:maleylpyruvate isomerase